MRDDVFNLAAFRSLSFGAGPDGIPLTKLKAPGELSFETALSRATAKQAPKPYVSPMKAQAGRTTTQSAAKAHKPTAPTSNTTTTSQTSLSRPTTPTTTASGSSRSKSARSRPVCRRPL